MVEDNASVKIVAEGPVATMTKSLKGEAAEINAGSKAVVDFQSTSATKQTLTLPKGVSQVNLSRGATFNVVGAATTWRKTIRLFNVRSRYYPLIY